MIRTITLPAVGITVSLGQYVKAIKLARENPDLTFKHGLTCWWSCTGREIMGQFREGITDRINQAIPYSKRGL